MPKSKPKAETPEVNPLEVLAGAALMRDVKFRQWLIQDPRAAAASVGVKLSDAHVLRIQGLDVKKLHRMAISFRKLASLPPAGMPGWG